MITFDIIRKFVEYETSCDILKKSRKKNIVKARRLFVGLVFLTNKKTTLTEVGRYLNLTHSTVINYKDKFDDLIKKDSNIFRIYTYFIENSADFDTYIPKEVISKCVLENVLIENKKLKSDVKYLKAKLQDFDNYVKFADYIPKKNIDIFFKRIEVISKMLNKAVYN